MSVVCWAQPRPMSTSLLLVLRLYVRLGLDCTLPSYCVAVSVRHVIYQVY